MSYDIVRMYGQVADEQLQAELDRRSLQSLRDIPVSFLAGALKLPSDLGHAIIPGNSVSSWWEGKINGVRDYLQSDELNKERSIAERQWDDIYARDGFADATLDTAVANPYWTLNQLFELGGGVRSALKAPSMLEKISRPQRIIRKVLSNPSINYATTGAAALYGSAQSAISDANQELLDRLRGSQ